MTDRFLGPPHRYCTRQNQGNDARILRDRQAAADRAADNALSRQSPFITARQLVQVYDGGSMGAAAELYYFTHPVLATGAETEGGTAVLTVDSLTTIPVVFLRGVPAAGDYATAYAVGGRWAAEVGGGFTCVCKFPQSDLVLTYASPSVGTGHPPLIYYPAGLISGRAPSWATGCFALGVIHVAFEVTCVDNEPFLTLYDYTDCALYPLGHFNSGSETYSSCTSSPFQVIFNTGGLLDFTTLAVTP